MRAEKKSVRAALRYGASGAAADAMSVNGDVRGDAGGSLAPACGAHPPTEPRAIEDARIVRRAAIELGVDELGGVGDVRAPARQRQVERLAAALQPPEQLAEAEATYLEVDAVAFRRVVS